MKKYFDLIIITFSVGSPGYFSLNLLNVCTRDFDGSLFCVLIHKHGVVFDILYIVGLFRLIKNKILKKLNDDE